MKKSFVTLVIIWGTVLLLGQIAQELSVDTVTLGARVWLRF